MYVIVICKYEKDPIKNCRETLQRRFPIITLWALPEFSSYLAQNLMQAFPHPDDASDRIWLQSAPWS